MDKLWAPWRSKYIYLRKQKKCIFCGNRKCSAASYVVARSARAFAMLNLYPYNNGHVMVAPYRHVKDLASLHDSELLDMMKLARKVMDVLNKKLKPRGYNLGINIGKVSGAGFAGHVHLHIVPRWTGDTNFMPVTGDTKVVSESLGAVAKIFKKR